MIAYIKALRRRLCERICGMTEDIETLRHQVMNLGRELEYIRAQLGTHLGHQAGAANVNYPHPNQLAIYREIHGPVRQSIASGYSVSFTIEFDDIVKQLWETKIVFKLVPVRVNATAASSGGGTSTTTSSGGGQTSGSGSAHSHSISGQSAQSGGGQTSSSDGSHSHSVSSSTTASSGAQVSLGGLALFSEVETNIDSLNVSTHRHFAPGGVQWSSNTNTDTTLEAHGAHSHHIGPVGMGTAVSHVNHTHDVSGQTAISSGSHTHTVLDHTHTVDGTTSSSESTHTHTVAAHTHDLTLGDHTHGLTYGIYEGAAASTPQVTLTINGTDRTAELGGPWNSGQTLDITQYLRDAGKEPLRQVNTLVFTSNELLDIEIVARSLVSAVPPFAIGL